MKGIAYDITQVLADYQDAVYNQAYRMLGDRTEAEDAAQEIFLKLFRFLDTFRGESKISSWIFRITANVCISRLRKKQHPVESMDGLGDMSEDVHPAYDTSDRENPESVYGRKEIAVLIRTEVRRLPPLWAQALSLHYFGGKSYDDIAQAMKIPRGTVATYMSRGKQRLAEKLKARLGENAAELHFRD